MDRDQGPNLARMPGLIPYSFSKDKCSISCRLHHSQWVFSVVYHHKSLCVFIIQKKNTWWAVLTCICVHLILHNLLFQLAGSLGILSYRERAFSQCFKRSLRSGVGNKTPQRRPLRTTSHTVVLFLINLTSQHPLFYLLSVCIPSHDNILSYSKVFVCIHLNIIFHGSLLLCPALCFLCAIFCS